MLKILLYFEGNKTVNIAFIGTNNFNQGYFHAKNLNTILYSKKGSNNPDKVIKNLTKKILTY